MVRDRSPGGHLLPSVPSAGREGRDERDALGPAAAVEDAGTAGTWLPGRRALSPHTHPSRWEPQSAGQGWGPGSASPALGSAKPILTSCAWIGQGCKCWLRLSNWG